MFISNADTPVDFETEQDEMLRATPSVDLTPDVWVRTLVSAPRLVSILIYCSW